MKRRALLTCSATLVPLLFLTMAVLLMETARAESPTQKGFSYATWWSGQYSHPDSDKALENLADAGADWISLIVTRYQDTISTTAIYSTTATPTDADLIHVITQAHELGLKVMLKPHVDLASDPTHWRGQIGQGFTEPEWNAWFASYQAVINHYAQLAQTHGADQFCVGTELSASESRETNWRVVIAGVRGHYAGPLTYAANHDDENDITWWDAVDYIGVDAYYPLTEKNDPTVAELKAAWQPRVSSLSALASTCNKSILFTEIGYRSQDGTNQHPWDWQSGGTVDLEEQADTYQALLESVFNEPWFAGIYWWAWEADPFQGGPCDVGYTPYDKPAEAVLRSWYGAPPRAREPTPQPDYGQTLVVYANGLSTGWESWSWDASVDLSSQNPVYSGTYAISTTAQAWGALSLHHSSFSSALYYWLEFFLRKSSAEGELRAFAHDENDVVLRGRPVEYCRYTGEQPTEPGVWTRVRIPLSHLNASGRLLERVSIQNYSSQPAAFSVDEIRLVGAVWRAYLPVVIRTGP